MAKKKPDTPNGDLPAKILPAPALGRLGGSKNGKARASKLTSGSRLKQKTETSAGRGDPRLGGVKLRTLSAARQLRLDQLMGKNSRGTLTRTERTELERLVRETQQLALENAERLAGRR